jgi:c-di-GMP-related signal transduction protein
MAANRTAELGTGGSAVAVVAQEPDGSLRYIARQPILDSRGRLHAYELLFRKGAETAFAGDGDLATRTMLDNSVMFGLEKLTGGATAFVNCTRESLTESLVDVLPSSMTVLEILEDLGPTPDLIEACRRLKIAGFRLALDDFVWRPGIEPLVELADYVKVDIRLTGPDERGKLLGKLSKYAVALLAEKVETGEEFQKVCAEGFKLIQGYYFCKPLLIQNRGVPANRISQVEILRLLHNDPLDLHELSRLVKRDTSLTYRLLRLINSPLFAVQQEVSSVEAALIAVGEDAFRRIATLAITSEVSEGQPGELLRMAFVRARFCELAARTCGLNSTEQYLLGLLSLFPAMLRVPMEQLTVTMPLREEIRKALAGAPLPERRLLTWLTSHEVGDWEACDNIVKSYALDHKQLQGCYAQAVVWAESALCARGVLDCGVDLGRIYGMALKTVQVRCIQRAGAII